MGDSTRMNRTARFMEEFGEAICQASWIKEGDVFKVTDIFLTNERGNVELVATIDLQGRECTRDIVIQPVYDPDELEFEELRAELSDTLGLPEYQVEQQLKAAGLD